ncbi:MAG: hypothetical protein ABIQ93_14230, partial [Saprospiraceae bacterium]
MGHGKGMSDKRSCIATVVNASYASLMCHFFIAASQDFQNQMDGLEAINFLPFFWKMPSSVSAPPKPFGDCWTPRHFLPGTYSPPWRAGSTGKAPFGKPTLSFPAAESGWFGSAVPMQGP